MAGNRKKTRKVSGSIKINGRGNMVLYLVRQAAPKNQAASTPAADISTEKLTFTPLSIKRKVSVQASSKKSTKKKATKVNIAVRKAKLTTKKLVVTTKKSVKIPTSKKTTAKFQKGKSAKAKIAVRKAAVPKTTRKMVLITKTKPAPKITSKSLPKRKEANVQDPALVGTGDDENTKYLATISVKGEYNTVNK